MIYIAAIIIGITLGLMGSGGSILTVPALVYISGLNPVLATGYSLFIVGTTSFTGVLVNKKNISYTTGLLFAIPSVVIVFAVRHFVLPLIPDIIFSWKEYTISKGFLLMCILSLFMLASAYSILAGSSIRKKETRHSKTKIIVYGSLTGLVTGFLGAGGGFLVIPALLLFFHIPIKAAVTTSLFIISINALVGFISDSSLLKSVDWHLLLSFTALSIAGILAGTYLARFIPAQKLKLFFGWFLLLMAVVTGFKEIINL